eukprot:g7.t1
MGSDRNGEACSSESSERGLGPWLLQGLSRLTRASSTCCGERAKQSEDLLQIDSVQSFEACFTVGELIGHGTFGKVYACESGSNLCVKVVGVSGRHAARVRSSMCVPFGDCVARDDMTLRGARPGGVQEQLCTDGDCVAARAAADIFSGRGFKESQRKISSPTMV